LPVLTSEALQLQDGFSANKQDLQHIVKLHAALLFQLLPDLTNTGPGAETTLALSEQVTL